ncbi:hypothetical protein [Oricola sp.]|uniref:hypothetical protein n=1 Tax=Oricola sp. TaxID=1979950 RepID=UPI0025D822F6|nr:hypothetical protein [Oricola sp.]MCI5075832.1 hypothetical protein [Oricola sp.]
MSGRTISVCALAILALAVSGHAQESVAVDNDMPECPAFDDLQRHYDEVFGRTAQEAAAREQGGVAVHFIYDASGSMAARIGGAAKIDIARSALADALAKLDGTDALVGLRAYGFDTTVEKTPEASCPNTALIGGFAVRKGRELAALAGGLPPYGYTPIAKSLAEAGNDLAGAAVTTYVVGFDLDADQRAQMEAIAGAGGGAYFDAADASGLASALDAALAVTYRKIERRVEKCDNPAAGGETLETAVPIEPGLYTLGELLAVKERRFYRVAAQSGDLVRVRGMLQSWRAAPGPNGEAVELTSALGAFTLSAFDEAGQRVGSRPARQRNVPGSSAVLEYAETSGDGFVLAVGDDYEVVAPDTVFAIDRLDVSDGALGRDSSADHPAALAIDSQATGHVGHDDLADVWEVALPQQSGSSEGWLGSVAVALQPADGEHRMRARVAGVGSDGKVVNLRPGDNGVFRTEANGKPLDRLLVTVETREPRLASRHSAYTLAVYRED